MFKVFSYVVLISAEESNTTSGPPVQLQTVFEPYNDKMTGKPNGEANFQSCQLDEEELQKLIARRQCECKFVFVERTKLAQFRQFYTKNNC